MLYHHDPHVGIQGQGHRSYLLIDLVAKHKSGELICPVTAVIIGGGTLLSTLQKQNICCIVIFM